MEINEREAETLKKMYEHIEEKQVHLKAEMLDESIFKSLKELNLINCHQNKVFLTRLGLEESKKIIRKHRLAEKLVYDALGVTGNEMETAAHNLELVMKGNTEECVCSLLNHPKRCPHGKQIPACSCNKESPCNCSIKIKEILEKSVLPLTHLKEGESGKIVYTTSEVRDLHERLPIDILPGKKITIIRASDPPLFQMDENRVTLNRKMAESIFVGSFE
ncbi:MAG: metal-dependent transcriptional regulator [Methanobacterium sp.]